MRAGNEVYQRIREETHEVLRTFTTPTGTLEVPFACHLVVGRSRSA
jgi:hypothetical protein